MRTAGKDAPFATVEGNDRGAAVLVWEQERPCGSWLVARRLGSVAEIGDAAMPVWAFREPTTEKDDNGTGTVLDTTGSPLWRGARVAFRAPGAAGRAISGTGRFLGFDGRGMAEIAADHPAPFARPDGPPMASRALRFAAAKQPTPEAAAAWRLRRDRGEDLPPYEVRLDEDPRVACARIRPAADPDEHTPIAKAHRLP